jgi:hypothetical protein
MDTNEWIHSLNAKAWALWLGWYFIEKDLDESITSNGEDS